MRQVVSLVVKALITLALLYFALRGTDFKSLMQRLQGAHVGWMTAAVALLLLQVGLVALRWREIAARCGADLPVPQGTRYTLIGSFFNQVLPSTVAAMRFGSGCSRAPAPAGRKRPTRCCSTASSACWAWP
jgi:uncharacterized membrane protein YbhN (UPF0104 family)